MRTNCFIFINAGYSRTLQQHIFSALGVAGFDPRTTGYDPGAQAPTEHTVDPTTVWVYRCFKRRRPFDLKVRMISL
jgi:hypothetical protein